MKVNCNMIAGQSKVSPRAPYLQRPVAANTPAAAERPFLGGIRHVGGQSVWASSFFCFFLCFFVFCVVTFWPKCRHVRPRGRGESASYARSVLFDSIFMIILLLICSLQMGGMIDKGHHKYWMFCLRRIEPPVPITRLSLRLKKRIGRGEF